MKHLTLSIKVFLIVLFSVFFLSACSSTKEVTNYECTISVLGQETIVHFTGTIEKNLPNGQGSFTGGTDDDMWSGEGSFEAGVFTDGEIQNFPISIVLNDQQSSGFYSGKIQATSITGDGTFQNENMVFTGSFSNGVPTIGSVNNYSYVLEFGDQSFSGIYNGEVASGVPSGMGTYTTDEESGFSYSGIWNQGLLNGNGEAQRMPYKIIITSQSFEGEYTGPTVDGLPEGEGLFIFEDGDILVNYQGSWTAGAMSGDGKLTDTDFVVQFSNGDIRHGTYEGETKDGHPVYGKYTTISGEGTKYSYTGEWENDIFNGYGEKIFENEDYIKVIGNFTNGDFDPTFGQYIKTLGTDPQMFFEISDIELTFLDEHPELFPLGEGVEIKDWIDEELSYKKYIKSPDAYNTVFIETSRQYVVQISEAEDNHVESGYLTEMITVDNDTYDDVYYVFYPGRLEDVYDGDIITLVGYPVGYSSYSNVSGGTTKCIILILSTLD